MNIENVKEHKNALLLRKDVTATITFDNTTPSRTAIIDSLAAKYKADQKLIVIKKIEGSFGNRKATVQGYIYDTEDAMKTEPQYTTWRSLAKDKKKEVIDAKRKAKKDRKKKPAKT